MCRPRRIRDAWKAGRRRAPRALESEPPIYGPLGVVRAEGAEADAVAGMEAEGGVLLSDASDGIADPPRHGFAYTPGRVSTLGGTPPKP